MLIEELQGAVESLSKENAALRKETDSLRVQVGRLTTENRKLVLQQQLSRSIPMSSDAAGPQRGSDLWMRRGMPQGLQQGMSQGLSQGLQQGLSQGVHRGMHMHMGLPDMSMLNMLMGGDTNIPPLLGRNAVDRIPTDTALSEQAREYLRNAVDGIPADTTLTEQTREYLRNLQRGQGPPR